MAFELNPIIEPVILLLELVAASVILGLDFTIGADMIKLAAAPDLSSAILATSVTAVRIALTLTLLREARSASVSSPMPH